MQILIIILLILFVLSLASHYDELKKKPVDFIKNKLKEFFIISMKDKQKVGTNYNDLNNSTPKSTQKLGNTNTEICYSTETRSGNATNKTNMFYCNQGIDGGEVIPFDSLYAIDFTNYNIHYGKIAKGLPLKGTYSNANGYTITLGNNGEVLNNSLNISEAKSFCDHIKEKCHGFISIIPNKNNRSNNKIMFLSKTMEGWEDPDTYIKMTNNKLSNAESDSINTNYISFIKKDVNYVEKIINENNLKSRADKYNNLTTCNWKSNNRCIFKDYKYDPRSNSCISTDDKLPYNITNYNKEQLTEWLKALHNRDSGSNKLTSEAANVNEYIDRCKEVDDYEFLSSLNLAKYIPPSSPGYVKGRYVRITINNRHDNWLQLAEVQVINNNRNIAKGKPATASSTDFGGTPNKANDGNNDGNYNNGSVSHNGDDGGPQFWEVDLGDNTNTIDRIIVSNRTDCCGNRLNNWLLSIYDNNKSLVWARIYSEAPNPKVSIDITHANNDMNNVRVKDYNRSRFNQYFYRVSDTEFNSKRGWDGRGCYEECHKEICQAEKKKWVGNNNWYGCREYRSGELEAELAEKKRLEQLNRFISIPNNTPHMVNYRGQFGKIFSINITGNTNGNAVWGSDIYTDDSDIRRAAVHSGAIQNGETKTVYIEMLSNQSSYASTTRNGITTYPYGAWGGSYKFLLNISDKPTIFSIKNSAIPNFNVVAFPKIGLMDNWEMEIEFVAQGGQNSWRAIIGDMYNNINWRGWGVWVSSSNSIHWSWRTTTWEPSFQVILGNRYTLKIVYTPNQISLNLFNHNSNTSQSASKNTNNDRNTYAITTNGPVTIGGWISYGGERFPGTVNSIEVRGIAVEEKNITVYEHCYYQGRSLELGVGTYDYNFINARGFNDIISSIKVPPGLKAVAWEHNPGGGRQWTFEADNDCIVNLGANDTISSIIVSRK